MAQFDVYRLADGLLVVDLQTDLIGLDATRIAAPLREEGAYARLPGLTPAVELEGEFEGRRWIVRLQELAPFPRASPGRGSGRSAPRGTRCGAGSTS